MLTTDHPPQALSREAQSIVVGPLSSQASLSYRVWSGLSIFTERYQRGESPLLEWDLREIWPRQMSMTALTSFLSLALRLRRFCPVTPTARIIWNPGVLGFLHDIGFFQLAQQHDLFTFVPAGVVGGYPVGRTSPHTRIFSVPISNVPSESTVEIQDQWKIEMRRTLARSLELHCVPIFQPPRRKKGSQDFIRPSEMAQVIATICLVCAELVVNALLHSGAIPFIGVQRTSRGITVSVCDSGRGFWSSLRAKSILLPVITGDSQAILAASLVNQKAYGLFRAIEGIVSLAGGRVIVSSRDGEIEWDLKLWSRVVGIVKGDSPFGRFEALLKEMGQSETRLMRDADFQRGGMRVYQKGLPGSRISFEMAFKSH